MGVGFATCAWGLTEPADATIWVLAAGLIVYGVGFGMGITPGTELIIEGLPAERRSIASAVNDITREVGGVLGIAILSSILLDVYRTDIAPTVATLPEAARDVVDSGAAAAIGAAEAFGPAGAAVADAAREAFTVGFSAALWVGAVLLAVAGVVCAAIAPGRPPAPSATGPTSTGDVDQQAGEEVVS